MISKGVITRFTLVYMYAVALALSRDQPSSQIIEKDCVVVCIKSTHKKMNYMKTCCIPVGGVLYPP